MEPRRVAIGFVAALLVIGGAVGYARIAPREQSDVVVTSKAASIAVRAPAFASVPSPTTDDVRAAWSAGPTLLAVGARGLVLRLDDPVRGPTVEASGTDVDLNAIDGVAGGAVLAVGAKGTILQRNPSAATWYAAAHVDENLYGVLMDDGGAVVVGDDGYVGRSIPDAWAHEATGTHAQLRAIARDGRGYVAVGAAGTIVTSPSPGAPWSIARAPTTRDFDAVAVIDGVAYAFGEAGGIARRDPGGAWALDTSPTSKAIRAVARGAGTLFALAEDGSVLRLDHGKWRRDGLVPGAPLAAIALRLDALWAFGGHGAVAQRRLF